MVHQYIWFWMWMKCKRSLGYLSKDGKINWILNIVHINENIWWLIERSGCEKAMMVPITIAENEEDQTQKKHFGHYT